MRGSSSGGTDFLTVSINTPAAPLVGGGHHRRHRRAVILIGWPVFGSIDSVLYGLVTTVLTSFTIDKIMAQSSSSKMLTIIHPRPVHCRLDRPQLRPRLHPGQGHRHLYRHRAPDPAMRLRRLQVYGIRAAAYAIDPSCMVMISETSEVYGEGFSDPSRKNAFS